VSCVVAGSLLHVGHSGLPSQEPRHQTCAKETLRQDRQRDQVCVPAGVWSGDLVVIRRAMEDSIQSVDSYLLTHVYTYQVSWQHTSYVVRLLITTVVSSTPGCGAIKSP